MDWLTQYQNFTKNPQGLILALILFLWSLAWKGIALWHASKNDQKQWFTAMLIINTLGILEIVYLFQFAKHKLTIDAAKKFIASLAKLTNRS